MDFFIEKFIIIPNLLGSTEYNLFLAKIIPSLFPIGQTKRDEVISTVEEKKQPLRADRHRFQDKVE
jgi:hypothetical protein